MSKLLAGPWCGEFGWELMRWQGIIRYVCREGKYDECTVICRKESKYLYRDFATSFLFHDVPADDMNMWLCKLDQNTYWEYPKSNFHIKPAREICLNPAVKQIFLKYGIKSIQNRSIFLHARASTNMKTEYRNWPIEKWNILCEYLKDKCDCLYSIGSIFGAYHIPNTCDIRGIDLCDLADYLTNAIMIISPSSGPVHFASLCGCPHLVWGGTKYQGTITGNNKDRYERLWNPLNTKCVFVDSPQDWQPDVNEVIEGINKCLIQ